MQKSALSVRRSIGCEHCLHTVNQRGQMTIDHGLDSQWVNVTQIVVNQDVPKTTDFPPGNGRELKLEIIGQHLRRFGKRLQIAKCGVVENFVLRQITPCLNSADFGGHI
jgi:hypothetical protein